MVVWQIRVFKNEAAVEMIYTTVLMYMIDGFPLKRYLKKMFTCVEHKMKNFRQTTSSFQNSYLKCQV